MGALLALPFIRTTRLSCAVFAFAAFINRAVAVVVFAITGFFGWLALSFTGSPLAIRAAGALSFLTAPIPLCPSWARVTCTGITWFTLGL